MATWRVFFSLASLTENAERQLSSAFYDTSEFLLRRSMKERSQLYVPFAILCPFFNRILSSDNDGEYKKTAQTRLLRFVAFVHLLFIFRSFQFDLFVATLLFIKGISNCVIRRKLELLDRATANFKRS